MHRKEKVGLSYKKEEDFSGWYKQLLIKAELLEYSDVSGCYILLANSYFVWEQVQNFVNSKLPEFGVDNTYFPLFVSQRALYKEKEHVEGFEPEVAWVTRSGNRELAQPIALRPTSETIMYPFFAKKVRAHTDLPLRVNQWANVVRWEFKCPTPFLRSREFLWQEGHCAYADGESADREARETFLDLHEAVYRDVLAVYTLRGEKTAEERFPGALRTYSLECFVPESGRGVQASTAHYLGENFARMFGIEFHDGNRKAFAQQNCWGLTTRAIGISLMQHSDNRGAVFAPTVAKVQVVIVPVKKENDSDAVSQFAEQCQTLLRKAGFRVRLDDRSSVTPGFKFAHWELQGVPLRLEVGAKEVTRQEVSLVYRNRAVGRAARKIVSFDEDTLGTQVAVCLQELHQELYVQSKVRTLASIETGETWTDFLSIVNKGKIALMHSCNQRLCEQEVAKRSTEGLQKDGDEETLTGAIKSLCISEQSGFKGLKCFCCEKPSIKVILYGRSY